MIHVLCVVSMMFAFAQAISQQIPWTPSMREPYTAPEFFVGLDASIGAARHDANLPYLDVMYDIPCCMYDQGRSMPYTVGLSVERWVLPSAALAFSVGIRSEATTFEAKPSVLPRNGLLPVTTQYILDTRTEWLGIGIGAKTRVFSTPLTIALNLSGHIALSTSATHREVVLGPDDFFFVTDPPSREHQLPTVGLSDIESFVLRPSIAVAYDLPLSYGYYVAPSFRIETTAQSISQNYKWNSTLLSVGFTFYKGL